MFIYKITNLINGKVYIGQTRNSVHRRWQSHCSDKSSVYKGRPTQPIKLAIQKYGKENFRIEQIDLASNLVELNKKETTWIQNLNSMSPNGYNMRPGGEAHEITSELRQKISDAKKGTPPWNKGRRSRVPSKNRKEILAESLDGLVKITFPSLTSLKNFGFNRSAVFETLNGNYSQYLGFTWRYA